MKDTNQVITVGRLTRDAELKYTNSGVAVCSFSIAVNTSKKSGDQWVDEANFFDVTQFGQMAESVHQFLKKGQQVCVTGHLKQDRWETDGQKRSKISIIAEFVQLLGGKKSESTGDAPQSFDADVPF